MKRIIAIDLGSNTCRAILRDCETGEFIGDFEAVVRTADRLHETGRIDDGAVARIVEALKRIRARFAFEEARIHAVTTAAMRMAANRDEALETIREKTGVAFELIDAEREAEYALLAVRRRMAQLRLPAQSLVMIDVGGGSTEIIFFKGGRKVSESFPIGIVTVAQQCGEPEAIRQHLKTLFEPVRCFADAYYETNGRVDGFVATAGTPTTIAAFLQGMTYDTYDPQRINGFALRRAECLRALDALLAMDEATRMLHVGVGRESLIVAGVIIVEMLYGILGFETATVIDDGVREGVAIAGCEALGVRVRDNGV